MKRKKIFSLALALIMTITNLFTGCGSSEPADLTGSWVETDGTDAMSAEISGGDIRVYWNSDAARALYWAGSYVAPTETGDYSWESENYTDETKYALLASTDATKTFSYSGGKLSFEMSMMGVTSTIKMEKKEAGETEAAETTETTEDTQGESSDTQEAEVKLVDNAIILDYVTADKSEYGFNICIYLENMTEDKVLTSVKYQYTLKRKSDETVIDTADLLCSYIAPGDTGIAMGKIVVSKDDMEDLGEEGVTFVSGEAQEADSVEVVPQSSLEVTGISAKMNAICMEFQGQVTNNSSIDIPAGASITLIAKKEGEAKAAVQSYLLDTITAGNTVSFDLIGTDDMDGDYDDYDVYIDYLVW